MKQTELFQAHALAERRRLYLEVATELRDGWRFREGDSYLVVARSGNDRRTIIGRDSELYKAIAAALEKEADELALKLEALGVELPQRCPPPVTET